MVQGGEKLGFALKAGKFLRMLRELFGKDFDGDFTPELGVPGAVHLAHTSGPEGGEYFVGSKLLASRERHSFFDP
jgi:hypothetical protein